jgi:hypothetical protein
LPLIFLFKDRLGWREAFLAILHEVSVFMASFAFEKQLLIIQLLDMFPVVEG